MRVKICGITNIEDALASVELGTDAIGLRIRPKLSVNNARLIVSSLPPLVTPVLLIYRPDDSTVDNIYALCNKIGVFTVQIYREISELSVDMLRRMISGIKCIYRSSRTVKTVHAAQCEEEKARWSGLYLKCAT